jgi:predicted transcriptional regulator
MVKVDDMSSDEAKAYLKKLQENTKKRQQDYAKRMKGAGCRRVNAFIDSEATDILNREQEASKRTVSEIISEALKLWALRQADRQIPKEQTKKKQRQLQRPSVSANSNYDKSTIEKHITELAALGYGPAAIARQFEKEGILTPGGGSVWHRATISRIVRRLKAHGLLKTTS